MNKVLELPGRLHRSYPEPFAAARRVMSGPTRLLMYCPRGATAMLVMLLAACSGPADAGGGQTRIADYEQARKVFWRGIYSEGGRTLYCDEEFGAGYNRGINIEHVFPMAWVTNALKCGRRKQCRETSDEFNRIEADLHNLYPARTDVNDARGAMSFSEISGERRWSGGCDFEVDKGRYVAEPRPGARGEIARAMFYMRDAYDMVIFRELGERLKRWHKADPVSAHERQRNDVIEKLQGTRNKYIDRPELVDDIDF